VAIIEHDVPPRKKRPSRQRHAQGESRLRRTARSAAVKTGRFRIKGAASTESIAALKPKVAELEDINAFSSRFMHSEGENTVPPSDLELRSYVNRAISPV